MMEQIRPRKITADDGRSNDRRQVVVGKKS